MAQLHAIVERKPFLELMIRQRKYWPA